VFFIANGREFSRSINFLADTLAKGVAIPYPELSEIIARAGIADKVDATTAVRRLTPHREEILSWLYGELVRKTRAQGALPMWIFVPQSRGGAWEDETAPAEQLAVQAGFEVVNLSEVFRDTPLESIRLAEWDEHPNELGHQMIAAALTRELTRTDSPLEQTIAAKAAKQSSESASP
jgi:hypothetical protein